MFPHAEIQKSRDGGQQAQLLNPKRAPLKFVITDFKRLPYKAIWTFKPDDIAGIMPKFPEMMMAATGNKNPITDPGEYVSQTVERLLAVWFAVLDLERRRRRRNTEVCYLVERSTHNEWGTFCRLTRGLMEEPLELRLPLTLPQCLLGYAFDGGDYLISEQRQ